MVEGKFINTVNASNFGGVPYFGGSNKMRFISILYSLLDRLLDLKRANESLSKKNECKVGPTKESHFFDPPKLGTPPKLEAMTVA